MSTKLVQLAGGSQKQIVNRVHFFGCQYEEIEAVVVSSKLQKGDLEWLGNIYSVTDVNVAFPPTSECD